MQTSPSPAPTQLLKAAVVEDRTTLHRITIWRKVKDGTFPKPVSIGANRIAWRESDIEGWIAACATSQAGPSSHVGA